LGYNGFGRLTGNETGSVTGGGGGGNAGGRWGQTGWTRMFDGVVGGQIAWLLPAALLLLVGGLWVTRRAPRTDRARAALALWGGWLLVTGLVFSFMQGIFHEYYTVALAPAIGALVGIGAMLLWRRRHELGASAYLGLTLGVTALWAHVLLARATGWHPWLATWIPVAGMAVAVLLVGSAWLPRRGALAVAAAALIVALSAPAAYAVSTAATPHSGSIVTAGPAVAGSRFGPGGGGPGGGGGFGGPPGGFGGTRGQTGTPGQGLAGGPGGTAGTGGPTGGFGRGGAGGLLNGSTASAALVGALQADAGSYTWVAAAVGSNNASGYQLASGEPVMAIGGFNGSDPSPTLAQFEAYVAAGRIHYFIGSGVGLGGQLGGSDAAASIASWVQANFAATTVGGTTVYDVTTGA
jgi:4-amino-4-deoxy-L-arabinose transferase-like glycosyltransferase